MSKPALFPETTTAGIAVDPRTLERVIPESRRPDGSVRKQIKIRPGFTPQEDVRRFRGTRQAQMEANVLPKGHVIGWTPPPSAPKPGAAAAGTALSKSAKKNEKRKEKRKEKREETPSEKVKDNWEDEDEAEAQPEGDQRSESGVHTPESTNWAAAAAAEKKASITARQEAKAQGGADALADELEKLEVH
ncbi:hypothetical protein BKA93DRAFT_772199 [Sparassis latifolia]|uniref:WIBG Mago-binding domain-containing protein n=1 Tax=Sparassis crispa TaxID=139825 RepID=A0A401GAU3_9APHY|nr:hypothetical protein SCP_0204830 [Sparassis crispa]GBE79285.1 hypothetical protein SCP_0204830 [Sparassis crispa]